ncbi:MAG: hypothetical protein ACR2RF_32355 [Geminicoccaceae bacterium]
MADPTWYSSYFAPSASGAPGMGTQSLMQLGGGLLSASTAPRSQRGAILAQAMDPRRMMQQRMMQAQYEEMQAKANARKAWNEQWGTAAPAAPAPAAGGSPGLANQPMLGGSLMDLPGGGTAPGQVQTALMAPPASPAQPAAPQLPPGVTPAMMQALGPQAGSQLMARFAMQQAQPRDRKTAKGADGFLYYTDTGERVLPGVEAAPDKPSDRKTAKDAAGFLRYLDTGERAFPDVQKTAEEPSASDIAGMRKEFSGQSKDYKLVRDAFRKIQNAATGTPSAGGDMSLIFSYMKMLDPGSTVREGEFATAQNTAGVPTQVRNMYNRAKTGEMLAPEQRADFLNQSEKIYGAQAQAQNLLEQQYRGLAGRAGYDPENVVLDYQGNLRAKEDSDLEQRLVDDPDSLSEEDLRRLAQ